LNFYVIKIQDREGESNDVEAAGNLLIANYLAAAAAHANAQCCI